MKKLISIIIPAYNEEECVDELATRLKTLFATESQYDFEAIIVENGSIDSTWEKLQKESKKGKCGSPNVGNQSCGRPGINGGIIKNPNIRFGVNCYGKKPEPSKSELALMKANMEVKQPETPGDRNLQAKMDVWKNHADKFLLVNSFNRTKWGE